MPIVTRLEAIARKFDRMAERFPPAEFAQLCAELCRAMEAACPKPAEQEIKERCYFEFVETPDLIPPNRSGWQKPHTPPLYCWVLQRVAVEAVLGRSPDMRLISNTQDMVGLTGATFVEVAGHPERLPNQVRENLRIYGWVVITIDDTFARARAAR